MLVRPDERVWKNLVAVSTLDPVLQWLEASRQNALEAMAVQQDEHRWRVLQGEASMLKTLLDHIRDARKVVEQMTTHKEN